MKNWGRRKLRVRLTTYFQEMYRQRWSRSSMWIRQIQQPWYVNFLWKHFSFGLSTTCLERFLDSPKRRVTLSPGVSEQWSPPNIVRCTNACATLKTRLDKLGRSANAVKVGDALSWVTVTRGGDGLRMRNKAIRHRTSRDRLKAKGSKTSYTQISLVFSANERWNTHKKGEITIE